jgi:hypothetical protein
MQQCPTPNVPGIVSISKEIRLRLDLSRVLLPYDGQIACFPGVESAGGTLDVGVSLELTRLHPDSAT